MDGIKIVLGANYGDEGKGLVVDYFASETEAKTLVVRHSGGAQAGHTVVGPGGRHHIFHHVGAGALAGADTFLSRYFLSNPILFLQEYEALADLPGRITVSPESLLTTPYDMIYNQMLEDLRGAGRHGSCGAGVAATMVRNKRDPRLHLKCGHLAAGGKKLKARLEGVRSYYHDLFDRALADFDANAGQKLKYKSYLEDPVILADFIDDCYLYLSRVELAGAEFGGESEHDLLHKYDRLIFEGSQGLLLDQGHRNFPHVTYANTGLRNAGELISGNYLDESANIEAVYVTRCYLTRHGAGPLPNELLEKPYPRVEDRTNTHNRYQGSLRYAYLDLDQLKESIENDLAGSAPRNLDVSLAITCLDQLDDSFCYYYQGQLHTEKPQEALAVIFDVLKIKKAYLSYGPTRETVLLKSFDSVTIP
ncbi:adenylosuccinate synthase [Deltaproteobacteria bacterium Smac51]|nr:adenylosuccinate synthase [Deltaproteobacteria bacterium Smac51]